MASSAPGRNGQPGHKNRHSSGEVEGNMTLIQIVNPDGTIGWEYTDNATCAFLNAGGYFTTGDNDLIAVVSCNTLALNAADFDRINFLNTSNSQCSLGSNGCLIDSGGNGNRIVATGTENQLLVVGGSGDNIRFMATSPGTINAITITGGAENTAVICNSHGFVTIDATAAGTGTDIIVTPGNVVAIAESTIPVGADIAKGAVVLRFDADWKNPVLLPQGTYLDLRGQPTYPATPPSQ